MLRRCTLLLASLLFSTSITAPVPAADPVDLLPGSEEKKPRTDRPDRTFKVASLNILGSQHTRGADHDRTIRTARLLRRQNVAVAGLQEVQSDQHGWLRDALPGYRIWPGDRYGNQGIRSQEADRDAATTEEIDLYQRLRDRGPVMIIGDANERGEWFCKVTDATDARAANGGEHRDGCRPPSPTYVDWLMGGGRFEWRHYRAQETQVSDHLLHTAVLRWVSGG